MVLANCLGRSCKKIVGVGVDDVVVGRSAQFCGGGGKHMLNKMLPFGIKVRLT